MYWPPSAAVQNLNVLNNCLLSVSQLPIVLCGDFNVPNINWNLVSPIVSTPVANPMCELFRDNYLYQLVTDPTRQDNVLDLVFTNRLDIVANVEVVDNLPFTDHDGLQFKLNISPTSKAL